VRAAEDVIDETPKAYKDIDAVMTAQSDLVEIAHTLRQIVCVRGLKCGSLTDHSLAILTGRPRETRPLAPAFNGRASSHRNLWSEM
jgi:tRNA-splicing ligase RtcB